MSLRISAFLLLSLALTLSLKSFAADRVLYSFPSGVNQGAPRAALVFDSAGNLYGTSTGGGTHNAGTVFMLVPTGGRYRERAIYSFTGGADGAFSVCRPHRGWIRQSVWHSPKWRHRVWNRIRALRIPMALGPSPFFTASELILTDKALMAV